MNLEQWKNHAQERLRTIAQTLGKMTPGMTYGALSAAAILPLVTAASAGQAPYGELFQLLGGVGGNLLANQLQSWKDKSEPEVAAEVLHHAQSNSEWTTALDTLLEKVEALRVVQAVLSEADKDELQQRFVQNLREELKLIGSRLTIEVNGDRNVTIGGESENNTIVTGDNNYVAQIINVYREKGEELDEAELKRQINKYLAWVQTRYGRIVLRGVEQSGRDVINLDLEQVYVPLQATSRHIDIRLDQLLGLRKRLIVTGGPGSGKTTVLQHIAWTMAKALTTGDAPFAQRKLGIQVVQNQLLPLPVYVPLSRYATYRRQLRNQATNGDPNKVTLKYFISHYLIERNTAPRLPRDFFARLLDKGQSLILLLDGLDEVANDDERKLVCSAIEDLTASDDGLRTVVTCRTAAYKGESMLNAEFHPVQVKPLEEAHVNELVKQAFYCIEPDDEGERNRQTSILVEGIRNFEAERQRTMGGSYRRLVDSPLMVRLLLIVSLTGRGFPEQRADLYERATCTLLKPDHALDEEVANQLGALVGGSAAQHRLIVEYVAFQMHSQGRDRGRERSESELKALLNGNAEFVGLADEFVALVRKRGGLMEEQMRIYRFFHLSFQEYLSACYLAKTQLGIGGVNELAKFFEAQRLLDPWWREPALLVAGYFVSNDDLSNARAFLRRLANIDDAASQRQALSANEQLVAVEIAGLSCLEWLSQDTLLCQALAARIAALFADQALMNAAQPELRAAAANALAQLGDPRPGVVRVANPKHLAISDLAWSDVIGTEPFTMGSDKRKDKLADDYEQPQFQCKLITQPYRICRYPITAAHYRIFMDAKGYEQEKYWTKAGWQWRTENSVTEPRRYRSVFELDNHPQVGVSWYEAVAFCNWLSQSNGLPMNDPLRSIRLPSEAEWERAARGTEGQIYPWGNDWDEQKCNNGYLGLGTTSAVGIFPASNAACGAADMSGNVYEWCSTKWTGNYQGYQTKVDDKLEGDGTRVLRGGSFFSVENGVRCAYCDGYNPGNRNNLFGFRVLLPGSKALGS